MHSGYFPILHFVHTVFSLLHARESNFFSMATYPAFNRNRRIFMRHIHVLVTSSLFQSTNSGNQYSYFSCCDLWDLLVVQCCMQRWLVQVHCQLHGFWFPWITISSKWSHFDSPFLTLWENISSPFQQHISTELVISSQTSQVKGRNSFGKRLGHVNKGILGRLTCLETTLRWLKRISNEAIAKRQTSISYYTEEQSQQACLFHCHNQPLTSVL